MPRDKSISPEIINIINNHKTTALLQQFHLKCFTRQSGIEKALKDYEKAKKELMKELQPFKHQHKQLGMLIKKVIGDRWKEIEVNSVPAQPQVL
jgi:hypothetical protein